MTTETDIAPVTTPPATFGLPFEHLEQALKAVRGAATKDETRWNFTDVYVNFSAALGPEPKITVHFTATDGHRLHRATVVVPNEGGAAAFEGFLAQDQIDLILAQCKVHRKARAAGATVAVSLERPMTSGGRTFPEVHRVIPERRENFKAVSDAHKDPYGDAVNTLGLNPAYIADAVKAGALFADAVSLSMPRDPYSPVRIDATDEDNGSTFFAVVMPVRL